MSFDIPLRHMCIQVEHRFYCNLSIKKNAITEKLLKVALNII